MYSERLLPHDIDAEEAVMGSLLLGGIETLVKVVGKLKAADFYRERNGHVFEATIDLYSRGDEIDQVTVARELALRQRLDDVGGMGYLSHLVAITPTPAHVAYYAEIVALTAVQRSVIGAAGDIAELGYTGEPKVDTLLHRAEEMLARLRATQPSKALASLRQLADDHLEVTEAAVYMPNSGIMTGFGGLDSLLGGLQRSDLAVVAARPAVGKTALALNIAVNAAKLGHSCAIFSLEVGGRQVLLRMVAAEAGVDSHKLRIGMLTDREERRVFDALGSLSDLPVHIDDSPIQSVQELRAKAKQHHVEVGLDLVVVDYMQLLTGGGRGGRESNRTQEMGEISRSLKGVARELDVPVLALSQLNRAPETRADHRPMLADLRESGSIEQDADVVMFLYRDAAYFTRDQWEKHHAGQPYPDTLTEVIVAKHRSGALGTIMLNFEAPMVRFAPNQLQHSYC